MIVTFLITLITLWNIFIGTYSVYLQDKQVKPGYLCKSEKHPYFVSIQIRNKGHLCGGSLLNKFWVLTAAHCKENFQPDEMAIFAGTAPHAIELSGVEMFRLHPKFGPEGEAIKYDIALVKVTNKIEIQEYANYVELPTRDLVFSVCRNCVALTVGSHGIIDPPNKKHRTESEIVDVDSENLHLRCVHVRALEVTLDIVPESSPIGTSQPGVDEFRSNNTGINQTGTDRPETSQHETIQPKTNQPGTNQPGTNHPGTNQPGTNHPGTNQPGTNQPVPNQPVTNQPGANQSRPDQLGATQPRMNKPVTCQTGTSPNASNFDDSTNTKMEIYFPFGFTIEGSKICTGDFGGPIMCKNQQIGVISRGAGCKVDKKGATVVTNVHSFIGWINELVSKDYDNKTSYDRPFQTKGGTFGRMSVELLAGAFIILEYLTMWY